MVSPSPDIPPTTNPFDRQHFLTTNLAMKKIFSAIIILITANACSRKRVITSQGDLMDGNKKIHWEIYTERDTTFKIISQDGRIISQIFSDTEAELKDSTFSEKDFGIDGKLIQIRTFLNGKPDGEWTSYYSNGKKKSVSITKDGNLFEYRSWYDNGKPQVNGKRLDNGRMERTEFFKTGNISQKFDVDSAGNGYCTSFFVNGRKSQEGNVGNYSPIGIWKRYDSMGNPMHDTLLGFLRIEPDPRKK